MNKEALQDLLLKLPLPLSKWAYGGFRRFVRPDPRGPYFDRAFAEIARRNVPGDYLEFGVYRGSSFVTAFKSALRHGHGQMRYFAFDSFEGLPHGEGGKHAEGDHACTQEVFESIVSKAGVDPARTFTVKGLYDATLNQATRQQFRLEQAAVVYIDCNLYTSTKLALDFVGPMLSPGAIVVFDDWHVFGRDNAEYGEVKAFEEWALKDRFEVFFDTEGPEKAFIMR